MDVLVKNEYSVYHTRRTRRFVGRFSKFYFHLLNPARPWEK
jgi:hypothetical protein